MSDMPPPPPDDSGWSSQPPPPPGSPAHPPHAEKGWATLGTGDTVQLARPATRLVARILDGVILAASALIIVVVGFLTAFDMEDFASGEEEFPEVAGFFVAMSLTTMVIGVVYEIALVATRGQTVGKMALKVKVVQAANGLLPGWGKSVGRWLVPAIPGLIGWVIPSISYVGLLSLLVYLSLVWDKVRQGWHDKTAGTLVIKV